MARMHPKEFSLAAFLLALVVTLSACGGGGGQSASEDTASSETTVSSDTTISPDTTGASQPPRQDGRESGTGAPIGRPSGGATGAPVKIPAITQLQGVRLDQRLTLPGNPTLLKHIENKFRKACGGALCVTLRIVDQEGRAQSQSCKFLQLEPNFDEERTVTVPRDSVVKIIVDGCPESPPKTESPTTTARL